MTCPHQFSTGRHLSHRLLSQATLTGYSPWAAPERLCAGGFSISPSTPRGVLSQWWRLGLSVWSNSRGACPHRFDALLRPSLGCLGRRTDRETLGWDVGDLRDATDDHCYDVTCPLVG